MRLAAPEEYVAQSIDLNVNGQLLAHYTSLISHYHVWMLVLCLACITLQFLILSKRFEWDRITLEENETPQPHHLKTE